MKRWLFKSEPDAFSYQDLVKKGEAFWDGVRNYQARNYLRDSVQLGDQILFYHSNADPSGVVGIAKVVKAGTPDPTQFDPTSPYFDPKANPEAPRWYGVTIQSAGQFLKFLSLAELKQEPGLRGMVLVQKGSRLSVQPVSLEEFELICRLGGGLH